MAWAATAVAGGALLGGLAGGMKKKPGRISLEQAKQRTNFKSGLGTSTADGFTYNPSAVPGQQQAAQTSGTQLNSLLSGGLAIDPNRQAKYQSAYYNARAPQLAIEQANARNIANNNRAASGASGSISALLGNQALNASQQQQNSQLQNQSVLGGEALANTALNQDIARAGVYNQQLQQMFSNQLNAQSANQNAFNAQAGLDINFANQRNGAASQQLKANAANRNFSRFGNVLNGAIGGGIAGFQASKSLDWSMFSGGGLGGGGLGGGGLGGGGLGGGGLGGGGLGGGVSLAGSYSNGAPFLGSSTGSMQGALGLSAADSSLWGYNND